MDTTTTQTPAPARSDLGPDLRPGARPAPSEPDRPFRVHGALLTGGAVAWGAAQLVTGVNVEHDETFDNLLYAVTSGSFQVGLLALLTVLLRTGAIGSGRLARGLLRLEMTLVVLAIGSTLGDALALTDMDQLGWLLLDMNWPLSMLGMFLIGVRIAVAGRWHGADRFWPLLAESWLVVVLPTLAIAGEGAATVVSALHLTLGYGVLGRLVARRTA